MPRPSPVLQLLVVVAVPFAWAFEALMRVVLFPPEFTELRELLAPSLVIPTWILCGFTLLAAPAALAGHHRALTRLGTGPPEDAGDMQRERNAVFIMWTTLAQVPALFGTFAYLFGGPLSPTLLAVVVSTAAVGWMARGTGAEPVSPD